MRKYELVVIIDPQREKAEAEIVKKIDDWVETDGGGKVIKRENWGKKIFAYPIDKKTEGIYIKYDLSLEEKKTVSFEQRIRQEEAILRYLLVLA